MSDTFFSANLLKRVIVIIVDPSLLFCVCFECSDLWKSDSFDLVDYDDVIKMAACPTLIFLLHKYQQKIENRKQTKKFQKHFGSHYSNIFSRN